MEFSNIFVVFDPTRDQQPAFYRAVTIAETTTVNVHLFACIHEDISNFDDKAGRIKSLIAEQKKELDNLAAPLLARGIQISTEVEWDKDWYHAVIRASLSNSADVVLKSSFKHSAGQRVLNKTSDWTLIRECLCPVLLVKEGTNREIGKVLAAVDIRKDNGAYTALNRHIVDFSQRVLDANDAEVHFINAFQELRSTPDRNALMKYCGVDSDRIHIQLGEVDDVIVTGAKNLNASLVVVGNSGRSGLSAMIRGNTVEKVLDRLDCDILSMP